MFRRLMFPAALALAVAACSPAQHASTTATVNNALTVAQQDAQAAINMYGIAKGLAEVAIVSDPSLAPVLTTAIAAADPIVAKLQTALTAADATVPAIEALVSQITAQANTLTLQAAPVVKAVPAAAA